MARRFATAINLNGLELQNAKVQNLSVAPGTAVLGQIYYDTVLNKLRVCTNATGPVFADLLPAPIVSADITDGTIVNVDINAAAAIAYSKLALAGSVTNADLAGSIAYSKLVLTGAIQNTDLAGGIAYAKLSLTGSIVNADVSASAAIAYSKLALTGAILNADIAAGANIARTKLDFGSGLVNADLSATAAIAYSKLALTGAIVNADIAAAAAIAYSKLNLTGAIQNGDLAGSIALTKLATDPLARANHTGTQLANTISNFDTQVRTSTLNQMAAPTTALAMNSQKISGLADGTAANDAVSKQQLDAVASGLDVKASVRVTTTATVTLATPGAAIDGVTLSAGDRVLLKDQTTASENGIWVFNGAATPLTRATDADVSAEVTAGLFTFVEEGTTNADTGWVLTTNNPIVLATTGLAFTQFSGGGTVTAGAGLTKTGNTLDVVGAANRILVNADNIDIAATYVGQSTITTLGTITTGVWTGTAIAVANGGTGATTAAAARTNLAVAGKYDNAATHGAGTTITITAATHGLGAGRNKVVQILEESSGDVVEAGANVAANGDVVVSFDLSQSANTMRVCIIGW